jgi:LPS export ABC transporter protein LptC
MPYKRPRKLKWILILVILSTVATIILIFIGYNYFSQTPEILLSTFREDADMSIGKIRQIATREGKKEWELEAESAHYMQEQQHLLLEDLQVTFFLKDDERVLLTAEKGILETDTKNLQISGQVVVKSQGYRLITDKIVYEYEPRIIYSKSPVSILGESAKLQAQSVSFDLNTKKVRFKGDVDGTFTQHDLM